MKLFIVGSTAKAMAEVTGVNRNTASSFFMRLRRLISSKLPSYELGGAVEADESYFGDRRKGKRGRGAAGKVAVFGPLKRGGKFYTAIIPVANPATLLPIVKEKVEPDSIVYTDTFKAYNASHSDLCFNMHTGISPYYRGTACSFWPMVNNEYNMLGSTVHECTNEVDSGKIYAITRSQYTKGDSLHTLFAKKSDHGGRCLCESCSELY